MLHSKLTGMFLGGAAILLMAGGLAVRSSVAQTHEPGSAQVQQAPPPGGFRPGGPGQPVQPGFQPGGIGGGGAAMVVDGGYLYVLSGQRLVKVNKGTFQIENEVNLRPQMRPPE